MIKFNNKPLVAALVALSLTACADAKVERAETNPLPYDMTKGEGLFSGKSGNILDAFKDDGEEKANGGISIGVNGFLWRSSLETISFMPVVSADSAGGVILTDWYNNPEKPSERVKVNVYILGQTLRPQNLKVAVFKQVQTSTGWQDRKVAMETATQLEETILTQARRLKVKEEASK